MKPWRIILAFAFLLTHASVAFAQIGPPIGLTEAAELSPEDAELLNTLEVLAAEASALDQAATEEAELMAAPAAAFEGRDIGAVSAPGSFTQTGDSFLVRGSGADIFGTADEFFYVYTPISGDFTAIVRVLQMDNTNPWAKAGLMVRQSFDANSPNGMVFVNPAGTAVLQGRSTAGGNTGYTIGGSAEPGGWLQLTRRGNTVFGYWSTRPGSTVPGQTDFELIGSMTISLSSSVYIGMAVTSHNDGVLCNATFDRLNIFSDGGGGGPAWRNQDIGNVSAAGSFSQGNTFIVSGSGYDIWGSNDEFHYAYQSVTNDTQITARILGMDNTNPWAKAGVMMRASVSDSSPNVLLALTPSHGLVFQWRSTGGGGSSYIGGGPASAPVWVRLVKAGDTVTGYRSADGVNWTAVGTAPLVIGGPVFTAGLAVTSHNDGVLARGNFDNVTITSGTGGGGGTNGVPAAPSGLSATATSADRVTLTWQDNATNENGFVLERSTNGTAFVQVGTFPADTESAVDAAAPGTRYWYRVAATNAVGASPYSNVAEVTTPTSGGSNLPPPWRNQDVGAVGVAGSAAYSQGTFTVKGSGADIWGSADAFHFVYVTVSGPGELIARVTGLQNTHPWAKAGIMVRRSQLPDSANLMVMATPTQGTGLQSRAANGSSSSYVPGPYWTPPLWLRIRRSGDVITGFASLNGTTWTMLGTQSIPMSDPILVGMAVTSHNNSVLNTATFDNVSFTFLP